MIGVEPGLYIGSTSDLKDCQELINAGITHILTVDSEKPSLTEVFKTKFVRALDEASTDLLSCLDDCLRFIHEGIDGTSGAVLVHCHAGQSRSAAVVTAFLMKSKQLNTMDAYAKLQQIKSNVKMNEEFLRQLELFESMNCEVDVTSPVYKQYRLQKITEKYPGLGDCLTGSSEEAKTWTGCGSLRTGPGNTVLELQAVPREIFAADPVTDTSSSDVIHRCRKCRRTVFRRSSVLSHTPGVGPTAFGHKKVTGAPSQAPGRAQTQCTSYFIEPVQWMEEALLGVMDGQLLCPKCNSKLGSFNWYGEQCSCGRWVTPAFQIHKNRVDEIKHISVSALK